MTRNGLKGMAFLGAMVVAVVLPPAKASAGYAQWVEVKVKLNKKADGPLSVKNASLRWGKWYQEGNKETEIADSDINQTQVGPGQTVTISSCGRDSAASGSEGSFDLYDGPTKVGTYSWDCPYGSKTNTSTWRSSSDDYVVQATGGSLDSGALGSIVLDVYKK